MTRWLGAGACALVLALTGCSILGSKGPGDASEYKGEASRDKPLDVPPDLSPLSKDERFSTPDQATSANALRSATGGGDATKGIVALRGTKARIVRDGAQRWLAVDMPPEKAYEVVKDFWPSVGLKVQVDQPVVGIVETEWQEKHERAPVGLIQRTLNLFLESLVSTGLQDKFRTRVERTPSDTSEIFITHQGLEEVYADKDKTQTTWQPRPRDPELEAEMLQRLLIRFETGSSKPVETAAVAGKTATPAKEAGTTLPSVSHVVQDAGQSRLVVDEPFDRAWRRVGLALDRGGFTVEDRDRAKGIYFVRYLDPDEVARQDKRGFFGRLFSSDPKPEARQYRIALLTEGDVTNVKVQDKEGGPNAGPTSDKLLKRLDEQMR